MLEERVTPEQGAELADMFRLLGEPNRLGIVASCLAGPTSVGSIAGALGIGQSLVSHHLRLLRAARLLRAERQGRQVFYAIADHHVRDMLTSMIAHVAEPHGHETGNTDHGSG